MSPLKAAIPAVICWIVLVIGIFYGHAEVQLKGMIAKERDEAISRVNGQLAGFGVVPWAC